MDDGGQAQAWTLPPVGGRVQRVNSGGQDIELHAWKEGREDRPESTDNQPNSMEQSIIGCYVADYEEQTEAAGNALTSLKKQLDQAEVLPDIQDVRQRFSAVAGRVQRKLEGARDSLIRSRTRERERHRILLEFQEANEVSHEARYPESKALHLSWALVIVLVECVLNTFFFAQGNDLGLLGGLMEASLISLANVGTAILVGYLVLRGLNHVRPWRKILSACVGVAYLGGTACFNLMAGHYRDLMAHPGDTLLLAPQRFLESPFDLSFHSILMVIVGAVAVTLGLSKGWTLDDRYPGYGEVHRDYEAARNDYEAQRAALQQEIMKEHDDVERLPESLRDEAAELDLRHAQLLRDIEELRMRYRANLDAIEGGCRRMLKRYRDANIAIRLSPAPSYFEEYPEFPRPEDSQPLDIPGDESLQARETAFKAAHTRLVEATMQMEAERDDDIGASLTALKKLFGEVELAVDQELSKEARRRVRLASERKSSDEKEDPSPAAMQARG